MIVAANQIIVQQVLMVLQKILSHSVREGEAPAELLPPRGKRLGRSLALPPSTWSTISCKTTRSARHSKAAISTARL